MLTTKLKVSSVSLIMTKRAVFLSPSVSSSISSVSISSRSSRMSNGASRAPQEMRIELRVLPADNRNFLYCRTAKCSGSFSSSRSNMRSTGLYFRLHSDTSLSLFLVCWRLAFSSFAFSRKAANAFRIEGFLSCVSFFAENSLKAAVSASASLPLKNTR